MSICRMRYYYTFVYTDLAFGEVILSGVLQNRFHWECSIQEQWKRNFDFYLVPYVVARSHTSVYLNGCEYGTDFVFIDAVLGT